MSEKKSTSNDRWWVGLLIYIIVAGTLFTFVVLYTSKVSRDTEERIRVQTLCEFQGGTFLRDGNLCVSDNGFISIEDK